MNYETANAFYNMGAERVVLARELSFEEIAEIRAKTGEMVTVRSGCFLFKNGSSTAALAGADTGGVCYVIDDQTVGKTGGTNSIVAGLVYDVESKGVWVLTGAQPVTVNITTQAAG